MANEHFIATKRSNKPVESSAIQLGGDLSGKVKLKVEPLATSLSTQIFPPCSSTNFLAKVNPSPVPSLLCAWSPPTWRNSSKIFAWSSGEIPIPLSLTEISTDPSACPGLSRG